jgi:hypothetical protein
MGAAAAARSEHEAAKMPIRTEEKRRKALSR